MKFVPKNTKYKEVSVYKTLYLKENVVKELEKIAKENDTSFNNVVVSMIEYCLKMEWCFHFYYKKTNSYNKRVWLILNGAPIGTRTPNLLVRSQTLYPIELWAQISAYALHYITKSYKIQVKYYILLYKFINMCYNTYDLKEEWHEIPLFNIGGIFMDIEKKVRELVVEKVKEIGVNIDSVEYVKEGSNNFLRITISKDDAVDVDTCVAVTNIISPILDENDIIDDSYILDITSKESGE